VWCLARYAAHSGIPILDVRGRVAVYLTLDGVPELIGRTGRIQDGRLANEGVGRGIVLSRELARPRPYILLTIVSKRNIVAARIEETDEPIWRMSIGELRKTRRGDYVVQDVQILGLKDSTGVDVVDELVGCLRRLLDIEQPVFNEDRLHCA